jgi:hypothetical protein
MLFRRLLESSARASTLASVEGYTVSLVAHAAIIGSTLVASHEVKPSDLANSFTPVAFFIPKDRIIVSRPKQERITYMSTERAGGAGDEKIDPAASKPRQREVESGPG